MNAKCGKPILLDLFCGGGGCSRGYADAGFDVVGVDIKPMKRYPYRFLQGDALRILEMIATEGEWVLGLGRPIAAIHASPPCQDSSILKHLNKTKVYPQLIPKTREWLERIGLPYIIENVPGAPLRNPFLLCGSMFGLRTDCGAELRRHRLFETNWEIGLVPRCQHHVGPCRNGVIGVYNTKPHDPATYRAVQRGHNQRTMTDDGHSSLGGSRRTISVAGKTPGVGFHPRTISVHGDHPRIGDEKSRRATITVTGATPQQNVVSNTIRETFSVEQARKAMGIDWMPMSELSQAIPPPYTRFIGERLLEWLNF